MSVETNECLKFDGRWFERIAWDESIQWMRRNARGPSYVSSMSHQYCMFVTEAQ
jgi:hypothetical protein